MTDKNRDSYDYLNKHLVEWKRKDSWHFAVYTYGYVSNECLKVEKALDDLNNIKAVSRKFDAKLGKTITVYSHS